MLFWAKILPQRIYWTVNMSSYKNAITLGIYCIKEMKADECDAFQKENCKKEFTRLKIRFVYSGILLIFSFSISWNLILSTTFNGYSTHQGLASHKILLMQLNLKRKIIHIAHVKAYCIICCKTALITNFIINFRVAKNCLKWKLFP